MRIDLNFAPGTTEACQTLVKQIPPDRLFDAYRQGRHSLRTSDIVVIVAPEDMEKTGVRCMPRAEYVSVALRQCSNEQRARLTKGGAFSGIANVTAHKVMKLPIESDVFWLVLEGSPLPMPPMCVIHAIKLAADGDELLVLN